MKAAIEVEVIIKLFEFQSKMYTNINIDIMIDTIKFNEVKAYNSADSIA